MLPVVDIPWQQVDLNRSDWLRTILASQTYAEASKLFEHHENWAESLVSWRALALIYSLVRNQRPNTVVEIGSYKGWTAQVIARALHANGGGTIHTVGPFDSERFLPLYEEWPAELKQHCKFHPLQSMDFYGECERQRMRFDLVFVDGNHDYEYALFDIQCAARRMNPGGFIIVDNISQSGCYYAAVDFLAQHPEWDDCGTRPRPLTTKPFDLQRTSIWGIDWTIMRAPGYYRVGERAVTFGEIPWRHQTVRGIQLTASKSDCAGNLHSQCILRGFGANDGQEVATDGSVTVDGPSGEILITFERPLQLKTFDRYSVEPWFILAGRGHLALSEMPRPFNAATSSAQLNALTASAAVNFKWETVEGIGAEVVAWESPVAGQPTLRLTATEDAGRHAVAVRIESVPRDHICEVVLWVKSPGGSRIMVEARDRINPRTGQPGHYGVARFDLSAAKVVSKEGDFQNVTIKEESDGWRRVAVEISSNGGGIFVLLGMLEETSDYHIFEGTGHFELTVGGIDVFILADGGRLALAEMSRPFNAATSMAQLNSLTASAASNFGWETAEGIVAEVIASESHVAGQPTLRLTATEDAGRHAVAVRFQPVPRDRVCQVILWVKGPEGSHIMVEARDRIDPRTGRPGHYGVARFDLSAAKVVSKEGDLQHATIAEESDGWRRLSVEIGNNGDRIFALLGMLEGANDHHIFEGTREFELTIGGIDLNPI